MSRKVRRILMLLLLVIFCAAGGAAAVLQMQYRASEQFYETAARTYVRPGPDAPEKARPTPDAGASAPPEEETPPEERCPISVDFDALLAVNPDISGWLYCEGTAINYPVLQGKDNDAYLRHAYDGSYYTAGSIFVEAANRPGFADANTIIYGHNMRNGIMFAELPLWADQAFYEEHPVFWLLTPTQDYRVELFSGYVTSATSEAYTVFTGSGDKLKDYLLDALERSDFQADVVLGSDDRYVMLSTCAYIFTYSRYVLHGVLRPVPRAE